MKTIHTLGNLDETVIRMKKEIVADMKSGIVSPQINSFSELNDYVDANEYGGFCDDDYADALIIYFGGRDANEGMPQAFLDYMNAAQDQIDAWLRTTSRFF